jgi:hypothetical protein
MILWGKMKVNEELFGCQRSYFANKAVCLQSRMQYDMHV